MERQQLEVRVQQIARACLDGRKIEDDRVELKREWPTEHHKTARQIAGHANRSRGERILWIVGLDEDGLVHPIDQDELSNWWPQIVRYYDGIAPDLQHLVVPVDGGVVNALEFDTSRGPYVVSTEKGGQVTREVPWRDANGTRSAHRHEILQALVAEVRAPELELVSGSLEVRDEPPDAYSRATEHTYSIVGELHVYVSALDEAMLPQHRQSWTVSTDRMGTKEFTAQVSPPFAFGAYTQWHRERVPVGHIEVLEHSGMFVRLSGEITVRLECSLTRDEALDLRFAPIARIGVSLPVDRTSKVARLNAELQHVANSEERETAEGSSRILRLVRFRLES